MFEVNEKGLVMVDAVDWQESLTEEVYKPAFGQTIDLDPATPVGALLQADVALGVKVQEGLAEVANCYNPFSATGASLTKIGNSYGYIRRQNTPARASAVFTGTVGTTVPAGFKLKDDDGNEWTTDVDTTVGTYVGATCSVNGTVISANMINTLDQVLEGVDGVSQPTAGVNGYESESDDEMSERMVKTGYSGRGRGTLASIAAAISNVKGVYAISFYDNPTNSSITWKGKTLVPHSIYFAVAGGADEDIARAIAITKTNGCSTNGSVTVRFTDPENTDYVYNYQIDRPVYEPIYVQLVSLDGVDLTNSLSLFKSALSNSQQLNAFPLGMPVTAVDIIDRIPKDLLDLGIVGCNLSTDGETWVKSISVNADVLIQIQEANVSIVEESNQ